MDERDPGRHVRCIPCGLVFAEYKPATAEGAARHGKCPRCESPQVVSDIQPFYA